MSLRAVTAARMRRIDERAVREYGIPALILMENAGRSCAEEALRLARPLRRAAVLAGKGNNGGDGFVAARHLANAGVRTRVYLCGAARESKGDAAVNLRILRRMKIPVSRLPEALKLEKELKSCDIIIDALYGTGLAREIRGPARGAVEAINRAGRPVLSVDVPSGLGADGGRPIGGARACVRASATVTFGLPKKGFRVPGARRFTGRVIVKDISLPRALLR